MLRKNTKSLRKIKKNFKGWNNLILDFVDFVFLALDLMCKVNNVYNVSEIWLTYDKFVAGLGQRALVKKRQIA